jgi:hypothetical protein
MQHSYHDIDDTIFNALEALFGPEIWTDSTMLDKAKILQAAGLTQHELQWTTDNGRLPSNFTEIFK